MLFIINFFITFLLLKLTARITKKESSLKRFLPASAIGGAYSFIILADIPAALSVFFKAAACAVIIACAFKHYRLKSFVVTAAVFMFSNFLFLGIIVGIYLIFRSDLIAIKNSTVYFDISAKGLMLCALFAYIVSEIIIRIHNRRVSKDEIYTIEITNKGKTVRTFAISDTGNRLREPFSDDSVIVVKSKLVKDIFDESKMRLIPASTVNSTSYLKAFKPDKIVIKKSGKSEVIENAYIALSDEIEKDKFCAVINPEILSV